MLDKESIRYITLFNLLMLLIWAVILCNFVATVLFYPDLQFSRAYVICVMAYLYLSKIGRDIIDRAISDDVWYATINAMKEDDDDRHD